MGRLVYHHPTSLLEKSSSMDKGAKITLLLVLLLSVSIYMNSIYGDFMLDDEMLIQKYPVIRHFSMDILTYRLVRTLSYAVDYHFWGLNPLGYHLSNLLYNTLTVLAVFFLTRRLTGIFFVSISTALLFAVHPIHTEAVSYLSGRRDILSALFYFLGFLSYIKARQERKDLRQKCWYTSGLSLSGLTGQSSLFHWIPRSSRGMTLLREMFTHKFVVHPERIPWMYGLVLLCYVAGILSKEMAVTLPLIIFAYEVILWIDYRVSERGDLQEMSWGDDGLEDGISPCPSFPKRGIIQLPPLRKGEKGGFLRNELPIRSRFNNSEHKRIEEEYNISLLWHAVMDTGKRFRWVILSFMLFVLGYLYVIIFLQKASGLVRAERFLWWGGSPAANFATVSRVIVTYIRKILFPAVLQVDYHQFPYSRTFLDLRVLSACALIISLLVISVILLRRHRLLAFSIWWFFITLLPVMQIIPHHILMAEHYLYLSSYGFCLALSLVSYRIYQRAGLRIPLLVFMAFLAVLYSGRTVVRNQDWQDIIILMKEGLRHNPTNPLYHFFLGRTYGLYKLYPSADRELAQSIGSRHDYSDTHAVKALVAFEQGDYEEGANETEESLKRGPENQMALYNMGYYAAEMGDDWKALRYYLKVEPDYESGNALLKIAFLYMKTGDLKKAEESLLRLMKMQPRNAAVYFGLAEVYTKALRFDEALRLYHEVLKEPGSMAYRVDDEEKGVDIPRVQESLQYVNDLKEKYQVAMSEARKGKLSEGHRILAEIYITIGNLDRAEKELKKSLLDASGYETAALLLLGDVYQKLAKYREAEEIYTRLLRDKNNASLNVLVGAGTFYAKTLRFKEASEVFQLGLKRISREAGIMDHVNPPPPPFLKGGSRGDLQVEKNPGDQQIREYLDWSIKLKKLLESSEQLKKSGLSADAALIKADVYVSVGRKHDAIRELEHALKTESENRGLLKALASLYETQGYPYWKRTVETYRHLLSLNENDADAWRRLGEFYYTVIQDYESALDCFQRSLSLNPNQDGAEQIRATIEKLQQYVKLHLEE